MIDSGWPSEWLRGILPLCVLAIVVEGETHGYAIAKDLGTLGLPNVKGGTLYPLLNRLEKEGLVKTRWTQGSNSPERKLYAATPLGLTTCEQNLSRWRDFCEVTTRILSKAKVGNQ